MFLFASILFNNLISKGILSIIYKFNLFLIARKMSIHFTNPPESTEQSFSGSFGLSPKHVIISPLCRILYFILIQIRSFRLLCTILNVSFLSILLLQFTPSIPLIQFIPRLFRLHTCFIIYFNYFHN